MSSTTNTFPPIQPLIKAKPTYPQILQQLIHSVVNIYIYRVLDCDGVMERMRVLIVSLYGEYVEEINGHRAVINAKMVHEVFICPKCPHTHTHTLQIWSLIDGRREHHIAHTNEFNNLLV